jgi:hypothetical protein
MTAPVHLPSGASPEDEEFHAVCLAVSTTFPVVVYVSTREQREMSIMMAPDDCLDRIAVLHDRLREVGDPPMWTTVSLFRGRVAVLYEQRWVWDDVRAVRDAKSVIAAKTRVAGARLRERGPGVQ